MQAIPLKQCNGTKMLQPAHIVRIQSSSNYSRVYFTNRPPLLVCKTLQWFQEQLPCHVSCSQEPQPGFVRVHRSHLVNSAFITERPAQTYLLLQDGQIVPVARRRKKIACC